MEDYRIVRADESDVKTIESIARRTWPDAYADLIPAPQIDYMLDLMYAPAAIIKQMADGILFNLLLETENDFPANNGNSYSGRGNRFRAVGFSGHEYNYEPGTTKLHKLYVLPGTQGKGYGRKLIRKVERQARYEGQRRLRLDVNYQNPALEFYEHLGFRKLRRHDTEIGHGYLMEDWQLEKGLG